MRWAFLWQRHQILAALFTRAGYPTVFVETTGLSNLRPEFSSAKNVLNRLALRHTAPKMSGPQVYSPLVLPPTNRGFRQMNRRLFIPKVARDLKEMIRYERPMLIAYPPTRTTLDLIETLSPRLTYYDRSEEYAAMPGVPDDLAATERELLRRCDLVSCTSTHLLKGICAFRPDAFLSGPGVAAGRFEGHHARGRGEKIVCYFGHLGEDRVRLDVLEGIADSGYEVRIVGETRGRRAREFVSRPDVDYRGTVPHELLPDALDGVDVFVMPYATNALTKAISPAKTFEALATGRPIIAAPIPSLAELDEYVYLVREPHEYLSVLGRLDEFETPQKVEERRRLARENSWERRFREVEEKMLDVLERA